MSHLALKPYEPTAEDLAWFRSRINMVRTGWVVAMPFSGCVYRVDHIETAWDATPLSMLCHHHNDYILRKLGWTILPAVKWEEM